MAKRVFFSFHHQDVVDFRANVVRKHDVTKEDREDAGFFDASLWEATKKRGEDALKTLINNGLENTTATCVLIGDQTYERPWVRYELFKSMKRGNKILAVHINDVKDKHQRIKAYGPNPLDFLAYRYSQDGTRLTMLEYSGGSWREYSKIDGGSSYKLKNSVEPAKRSQAYKFSQYYSTYAWTRDNGYENFSDWIL